MPGLMIGNDAESLASNRSTVATLFFFVPALPEVDKRVVFVKGWLSRMYPRSGFRPGGNMRTYPCSGVLGSVFDSEGFFADFYCWARFFSRILSPDFFSSSFGEKVPRKILQENPLQKPPKFTQQKSPTHFCRGAGPRFSFWRNIRQNPPFRKPTLLSTPDSPWVQEQSREGYQHSCSDESRSAI